jgi:hypothetical protein
MDFGSLAFAAAAFAVSLLSFYFSIKSWRESNRPLITARVSSLGMGGNRAIPLTLLVENTGNRPAKNIRLTVDNSVLERFLIGDKSNTLREQVELCFSSEGVIPVLANGRFVSNSFGLLSEGKDCTWKVRARFEIFIDYEDLDGRKLRNKNPLFVGEDRGFASGFWELSKAEQEGCGNRRESRINTQVK